MSLDPIASRTPTLSPYSTSGNNPILFVDIDGKTPGHLALFIMGAGVNLILQYSVQYAITGDAKAALEKVDLADVFMTGLETMAIGPAGLEHGLSTTFARMASAELIKGYFDWTYSEVDGKPTFVCTVAGQTKDGDEFCVEVTSGLVFGFIGDYLDQSLKEFYPAAAKELDEMKRQNTRNKEDLKPYVVVNGIVQDPDVQTGMAGAKNMIMELLETLTTDKTKEKIKAASNNANDGGPNSGAIELKQKADPPVNR